MQGHELHIFLIILQSTVCFLILFRGKLNYKFLTTLLLFVALGIYSSPSRLVLAHNHQSNASDAVHVCCQPLTAVVTPFFDLPKENLKFVFENQKEITLLPLSVYNQKSIRSPPITAS